MGRRWGEGGLTGVVIVCCVFASSAYAQDDGVDTISAGLEDSRSLSPGLRDPAEAVCQPPSASTAEPGDLAEEVRAALARDALGDARELARELVGRAPDDEAWGLLGMVEFRRGDHRAALRAYRCALAGATPSRRVLLRFNEASALYELERVEEAEEVFADLAAGDPPAAGVLAGLAATDAAFAAMELGELERAIEHLRRATALDAAADFPAEFAEASDALRALHDQAAEIDAELCRGEARARASAALSAERFAEAAAGYEAALACGGAPTAGEIRALRAGQVEAALGQGEATRAHDLLAAWPDLDDGDGPDPAYARLLRGRVSEAVGARAAAMAHYARAEELAAGDAAAATRAEARARYDRAARGLRAHGSGWYVSASVGGGVDSNPAQSGVGGSDALSLSASEPVVSGFVEAAFGFGYSGGASRAVFLTFGYAGEQMAYPEVQLDELSIQSHALRGELELRAHPLVAFRFGTEGAILASGLQDFAPMVFEGGGSLRVDVETGPHTLTIGYRGLATAPLTDEYDFLAGHRHETWLEQRLRHARVDGRVRFYWRREIASSYRLPLTVADFPICATGLCDGSEFQIPLSHHAPGARARVSFVLHPEWSLALELAGELRFYSEEFFIVRPSGAIEQSRKLREDQRVRARVELAWLLHANVSLELYGEFLQSWSNIDNSSADETNRFDYDNRNYQQLLAGLRVDVEWD